MGKLWKTITKRIGSLAIYDVEGTVDALIAQLQEFQRANPDYTLYIREAYGYDDVSIVGERDETDEERNKRLIKEKGVRRSNKTKWREHAAKKREQKERKTYEKLKAKFGEK